MNTPRLMKYLNGNIKDITKYAYRNISSHILENYF